MKKILLSLAMVLAGVGAWAQDDATRGLEVTFTNVQKDGTKFYLHINDDDQLAVSADSTVLETPNAKFRMTLQSNGKYTFYNVAKSRYMIWRGNTSGGHNGNKGVLETYDANYCDWNLKNATEGTFYIVSKRANNDAGSIIIMKNPLRFDAYGDSPSDLDNYSNAFIINGLDDVTFTYVYNYNGEQVKTEEKTALVGTAFPAPNLPVGVTATSKTGAVQQEHNGQTFTFDCTDADCPIEFAEDAENITKWYYLKVHSNQPKYIQNLDANGIGWANTQISAEGIESHLWGFVGNPFKTQVISKSASTSGIVSNGDGATSVNATPTEFYMAYGKSNATDKFCLQNTTSQKYLNGHGGKLQHWSDNDAGSDFIPVEYTETDIVISATDYATMYLDYQAYIPEGVKTYIVSETTGTSAKLQEITGIIPENTGVLLKTAGTFKFKKAIGTPATVEGNKLLGTAATEDVTPASGATCYVLHKPTDGAVGFYKTKLTNGKFKNNANKAYLSLPASAASARAFLFDFGTETGIDCIESVDGAENANAAVYDLAGRRVKGAQKGLYIVNGKVVIK